MGSMGFAPHTTIVSVLRNTGETSIGVLAYKVGREEWEIRPYLETLRKEGIVSIDGNKISLTNPRQKGRDQNTFPRRRFPLSLMSKKTKV